MTHPSKTKGNSFEREVVNAAKNKGLEAERAYASNGKSLGHAEDVDAVISGFRIQCKRRKKIAKHLLPSETVDAVAFRPDRGETVVLMNLDTFLELLAKVGEKRYFSGEQVFNEQWGSE